MTAYQVSRGGSNIRWECELLCCQGDAINRVFSIVKIFNHMHANRNMMTYKLNRRCYRSAPKFFGSTRMWRCFPCRVSFNWIVMSVCQNDEPDSWVVFLHNFVEIAYFFVHYFYTLLILPFMRPPPIYFPHVAIQKAHTQQSD